METKTRLSRHNKFISAEMYVYMCVCIQIYVYNMQVYTI